jgi:hypothetical protein
MFGGEGQGQRYQRLEIYWGRMYFTGMHARNEKMEDRYSHVLNMVSK